MVRPTTLRTTMIWAAATVVLAVLLALVPLQWEGRYYFYGDTQVGAFGQWYELGTQLRSGHWPLLDLTTWRAGNYAAEGQWGLWNPLVMIIGLVASSVANAVTFVTVLKIGMIVLASIGGYTLACSYGARPELAFVAGLALPLGARRSTWTARRGSPASWCGPCSLGPGGGSAVRFSTAGARSPVWVSAI